ncbi:MAG: ABC transporter ATP-binding protein/permease [Lachnospiraceae bacterium]|jgi:ATP-binding cassette subfamily B protein|nr:ABC transporter ATP-binding protein/permease [Lachnospiraceae bacterium]
MTKLLKLYKPHLLFVFFILIVLGVQAYCDLSLPTYTSEIVNVGIQQGGVTDKIPVYMDSKDMYDLLVFVPDEDVETVKNAYSWEGDYYALINSDSNSEEYKNLTKILSKPMLIVNQLLSDPEKTDEILEKTGIKEMGNRLDRDVSTFELISWLPAEVKAAMFSEIDKQIEALPESMVTQACASYIHGVYERVGIDMDKFRNNYILSTGGKMLLLAGISALASILVSFLSARVGAGIGRKLRGNVFRKVVGFSHNELDKFSTASLITRSTNDIQQVQMMSVFFLRMMVYAPILGIGGIWKVFHTNSGMAWIAALAVGIILFVVTILFQIVMPKFKIMQTLVDRLNLISREILTGLQVIRAFNAQKQESERFDKANKDLKNNQLFVNRIMTFMMPFMMFVMNSVAILIVWTGAHGIENGAMQVGDMMAFIQYMMQIMMSFLMISMLSVMLPRAVVSAVRIDEVLQSESSIKDPENPKAFPENAGGEIVFEHVSFRYPDADEDVLTDISFDAKPGHTTAFIGSTGSGKTTLLNLIPRFYDVTEGKITVDGVDIRDVKQSDLRDAIGLVSQKAILFSGNIASNIMYGNENGTEEEMKEAARIAQATEFIDDKEEGYESLIAQGGANVSGGQKQRLSIARAIASDPKIYLFDDSFSALDYKTDATLRKELRKITANATVLIVAQRVGTILTADEILVLDDGKIVGRGTHEELLKTCDTYYQIAASQLSEDELKPKEVA